MFAVPAPAFVPVVLVPYAVVFPYSNCQVVVLPFGLTVPLTFAEVAATVVTGPVIAVGAVAAPASATTASSATDPAAAPPSRRLPM